MSRVKKKNAQMLTGIKKEFRGNPLQTDEILEFFPHKISEKQRKRIPEF